MPKKAPAKAKTVVSIKGFDAELKCRGFQFEIGGSYEHPGEVKACSSGFHACPEDQHPLSVFEYYPPAHSRYCRVVQGGKLDPHGDKIASGRITIEGELRLPELIQSAVKWVFDRANWTDGLVATLPNEGVSASGDQGAATASGYQGAATASGDQGAATASGTRGAATASGDQGAATASGYQGAATASGTRGAATASGYQGAATASGWNGRVRGKEGSALFLVYRPSWDGPIEHVWAGIAGRDGIKADTWYVLDAGGQPIEWSADQ